MLLQQGAREFQQHVQSAVAGAWLQLVGSDFLPTTAALHSSCVHWSLDEWMPSAVCAVKSIPPPHSSAAQPPTKCPFRQLPDKSMLAVLPRRQQSPSKFLFLKLGG